MGKLLQETMESLNDAWNRFGDNVDWDELVCEAKNDEISTAVTYMTYAAYFKDGFPELSEVLVKIAEEEFEHYKEIIMEYEFTNFFVTDSLSLNGLTVMTKVEIVNKLINLEKEAIVLYDRIIEKADEKKHKEFFEEIRGDEIRHQSMLAKVLENEEGTPASGGKD
jgi:rubrerythrin